DGEDGAEALLDHDLHRVVAVGDEGGLEEAAAAIHLGGLAAVEDAGAGLAGGLDLARELLGGALLRQGTHGGLLVERVTETVRAQLGEGAVEEGLVELAMDVDALDGAAALAGVPGRAVDDVGDGELEVGVLGDVGRVLA